MNIDRSVYIFIDYIGVGAWLFLVGGVICLVNSVIEENPCLINSDTNGFPLKGYY